MSDVDSIFSFSSPSASPTLNGPPSQDDEAWSAQRQTAAAVGFAQPQSSDEGERRSSYTRSGTGTYGRAGLRHSVEQQSDMRTAAMTTALDSTSENDWQQQQQQQQQQRGRTHRKRSTVAETYVCVIAWLIRPGISSASPSSTPDATISTHADALLNQVQEIRRMHDNAYRRWEPHVTLVPPFLVPFRQNTDSGTWVDDLSAEDGTTMTTMTSGKDDDDNDDDDDVSNGVCFLNDPIKVLGKFSERIAHVCAQQPAMRSHVSFDEMSKFGLRRYDTFHLRPSAQSYGAQALAALQNALSQALPEASESSHGGSAFRRRQRRCASQHGGQAGAGTVPSRLTSDFKPHLTLGQATMERKGQEIEALAAALLDPANAHGGPLSVPLDTIQLMYKPLHRSGPYDVFQEFSLGQHRSADGQQ